MQLVPDLILPQPDNVKDFRRESLVIEHFVDVTGKVNAVHFVPVVCDHAIWAALELFDEVD
jgi:hypothetical protein